MERIRDWLDKRDTPAGVIAGVIAAALVIILLMAYMALCVWVQRGSRLLPGTVVVDSQGETVADLGRLTRAEAAAVVAQTMDQHQEDQGLTLLYGENRRAELSGSMIVGSAEATVDMGFAAKRNTPNWKLGVLWLGVMTERTELPLSAAALTSKGETQVKQLINSIADELYIPPEDFTYEIGTEAVVVTPGADGAAVDTEALLEAVKEALSQGRHELRVEAQPLPGAELTGRAIQERVRVEPKPAGVDENGDLVPAVVGLSVSAEKAQAVLDAGPEGPYTIPLEFTPPAPAEDDSMFYKDLLSQFTCALEENGAAAADACNGRVLQPGELFSVLDTVGSGQDRVSSSLYYCAVCANLSIVERTGGVFAPDYMESGLDAVVTGPDQDLKFRNSTGFPIKLAASVSGGSFTVQFYGSNPEGIRVEIQRETRSTTQWTTVYEADSTVRRGSTTERTAPAEGGEVEVYRCVYDAGGNLLSRTLENSSTYEKRDRVIRYNPADTGPWGAGTAASPAENPTSRPNQSAQPTATSSPAPTEPPAPVDTSEPTPAPTPEPTEQPPEVTMPGWLQPAGPETEAPVPTDPPPQATMPDWLQ